MHVKAHAAVRMAHAAAGAAAGRRAAAHACGRMGASAPPRPLPAQPPPHPLPRSNACSSIWPFTTDTNKEQSGWQRYDAFNPFISWWVGALTTCHGAHQTTCEGSHQGEQALSTACGGCANGRAQCCRRQPRRPLTSPTHVHTPLPLPPCSPPNQPLRRVGSNADGGKILCDVSRLETPCVIYSLGSQGDYSFEREMLNLTRCDVHTFDCERLRKRGPCQQVSQRRGSTATLLCCGLHRRHGCEAVCDVHGSRC